MDISSVKIGLAPMEGVTDFATRAWFHLVSRPDFLSTPFLRVTETYPKRDVPADFFPDLHAGLYPVVPQIMASDEESFLRAAESILSHTDVVDLNCGCPSPKTAKSLAGSSLLRDLTEMKRRFDVISKRIGADHFGVKLRIGFDSDKEWPPILDLLETSRLARLTVHGRTRRQAYRGAACWRAINLAETRCSYPVWGSGDIVDVASMCRNIDLAPSVKTVIIGRGALRNPWIFEELRTGSPVAIRYTQLEDCLRLFFHMQAHGFENPLFLLRWLESLDRNSNNNREKVVLGIPAVEILKLQNAPTTGRAQSRALRRTKMLWGYLRSSLPKEFFQPLVLRSKSLDTLLDSIRDIASSAKSAEWTLVHNSEWDFLYAGGRARDDKIM